MYGGQFFIFCALYRCLLWNNYCWCWSSRQKERLVSHFIWTFCCWFKRRWLLQSRCILLYICSPHNQWFKEFPSWTKYVGATFICLQPILLVVTQINHNKRKSEYIYKHEYYMNYLCSCDVNLYAAVICYVHLIGLVVTRVYISLQINIVFHC